MWRNAVDDAAQRDERCGAARWTMRRSAMDDVAQRVDDVAQRDGRCGATRRMMWRSAMDDVTYRDG